MHVAPLKVLDLNIWFVEARFTTEVFPDEWLKSDWMSKQDEETQTKVETRGREGCGCLEMHTNKGGMMGQFACLSARPGAGYLYDLSLQ